MVQVFWISLKSIVRDRILHGILFSLVLFVLIPTVSTLSMRQGVELSITLSLSLISFILLLVAVFLGGTSLWRDIDRRYVLSVLSLPVGRTSYVVGRFIGIALFLLIISIMLASISMAVVWVTSLLHPPSRPISWSTIGIVVLFSCLKYILLTACAFLFSTFSTSFFLPVFGTIATYFTGNALQQVYEYVVTSGSGEFGPFLKSAISFMYYLLPNLGSFDFQMYAIYGLQLPLKGMMFAFVYFVVYTLIILTLASMVFHKRELK